MGKGAPFDTRSMPLTNDGRPASLAEKKKDLGCPPVDRERKKTKTVSDAFFVRRKKKREKTGPEKKRDFTGEGGGGGGKIVTKRQEKPSEWGDRLPNSMLH